MTSREELAHLARDWDAQAAQIEKSNAGKAHFDIIERARVLRECARQLRERLAGQLHPDALDRAAEPDRHPGP